jgi:formimidoylglutamate deiminase
MHVEEQLPEVEQSLAEYGKTPLRVLLDMEVPLDHVTLIHCIHSIDTDMDEFIAKGTLRLVLCFISLLGGTVCVCPLTEAALADGLTNIYQMDGKVCLGTDCNARIDFLEEMRWLEFGQRIRRHKRGACCDQHSRWVSNLSKELLAYATVNGAKALHVDTGA